MPLRTRLALATSAGVGTALQHLTLLVVQGVLPLAGLWAMLLFLTAVTTALKSVDRAQAEHDVLVAVGLAAAVALTGVMLRAVGGYVGERHARAVTDRCVDRLHRHAATLDLGDFEQPTFHDLLHKAAQEAGQRPGRVLQDLAGLLVALVTLLTMGTSLATLDWWLPVLVTAAALPALWLRRRQARAQFAWQEAHAAEQRAAIYHGGVLTGRSTARELRLLDLGTWFGDRLAQLRTGLRRDTLALAAGRARGEVAGQVLASAALFATYIWLGSRALDGRIDLPALVFFAQAVQRSQNGVRDLLGAAASLAEHRLFLRNYYTFLQRQPQVRAPAIARPLPSARAPLHCEGVTFRYPGASAPVLHNLSFTLRPGERVALVGRNGAGKSTVLKLLARLYDPDQGSICYGDCDLRLVEPMLWRARLSVLPQDSQSFELSLRDNLLLGDLQAGAAAAARMPAALGMVGMRQRIEQLPQGYDTMLGRRFAEGAELSAGETRRLLLARALVRSAEWLILDEPSAFLDAAAEAQFFAQLATTARDTTILLVDHRPAALQFADRILVLDGGRIVADGTFASLAGGGGPFARLFGTGPWGQRPAAGV